MNVYENTMKAAASAAAADDTRFAASRYTKVAAIAVRNMASSAYDDEPGTMKWSQFNG
jgi:hypothetical protein